MSARTLDQFLDAGTYLVLRYGVRGLNQQTAHKRTSFRRMQESNALSACLDAGVRRHDATGSEVLVSSLRRKLEAKVPAT